MIDSNKKEKLEKLNINKTFITNELKAKLKELIYVLTYAVLGPLMLYALLLLLKQFHLSMTPARVCTKGQIPTYYIYTKNNETGYLKHVHIVLERLGFQRIYNESDWDLLWAHDYPFRIKSLNLNNLNAHKKVNHFPGSGYITNKVDLSTSHGKYIPAAFRIPEDKELFLEYVNLNPNKSFVQKLNDHRGIKLKNISDIDLVSSGSFVQEFIDRPFLVDGYKFDIGIYTVITSIDPLRVYTYKGDALFRFCPIKYHPFDPEVINKYVVGDDYLPIWNVPSLKYYYTKFEFSMKDSFDAYVKSIKKDPRKIWENINKAIREVTLMKEKHIKDVLSKFNKKSNFFELVRFDFTLDENLNVYTMEANMSPNLSSAHFPPNQLLYEQVLYNMFALVGIGQRIKRDSLQIRNQKEEEMAVANKNIVVLPEICINCQDCFRIECQLCNPCFSDETKSDFTQSYLEHQNKMDFERVFPPPITKNMILKDYTLKNQLLIRWYQGKCELDNSWCT